VRAVCSLEDIVLNPNLGLLSLGLGAGLFNRAEITDVVNTKVIAPVSVFAGLLFLTFTPLARTLINCHYLFLLLEALAAILEGRERHASYSSGFVQSRISSRSKSVQRNLSVDELERVKVTIEGDLSGSDGELLVGSIPLFKLYEFMKRYRAVTQDLAQL
jgi:hypothetical protein